jgi:plastocyanin
MLKKLPIILAFVVVVLVLVLVFWRSPESETPTGETPTSQVPAPGFEGTLEMIVEAGENKIVFTDAGFSPNSFTVQTGDMVTFINESSASFWPASAIHPTHKVYSGTSLSEHCPGVAADSFDACGGIPAGESWSFTFLKPGIWKYHDHLNASRTGMVVVE